MATLSLNGQKPQHSPIFHMTMRAVKEDSEETVQDLGMTIVHHYLPYSERYTNRNRVTNQNKNNNVWKVEVTRTVAADRDANFKDPSRWKWRLILQVHCKRRSASEHLYDVDHTINSPSANDWPYLAMAAGKTVKLFRFNGQKAVGDPDRLIPLHPGEIDLSDPNQRPRLEYWMELIKENGSQSAC